MATTNAARAVGLDEVLGSLIAGNLADIAVYRYNEHPSADIDAVPTIPFWLSSVASLVEHHTDGCHR